MGFTPIHKATLYGHAELVDYIASKHPETLDARDYVSYLKSVFHFNQVNLLNLICDFKLKKKKKLG